MRTCAWKSGSVVSPTDAKAWDFIKGELDQLVDLMEDDRERYMAEALGRPTAFRATSCS
jgi:hypothetical protein